MHQEAGTTLELPGPFLKNCALKRQKDTILLQTQRFREEAIK